MPRRTAGWLAVALVAAACSVDVPSGSGTTTDPGPSGTTTSPSTTDAPTSTPSPRGAVEGLATPGAPVDLGTGTVMAVAPGGRHLLVSAADPDSDEMGCEGVPFEIPWSVDVDTGERVRAIDLPTADQPFVTMVEVQDDRALLIGSCEGFLGALYVADIADDGLLTNLRELQTPPADLSPWTIRWMPRSSDVSAVGAAGFGTPGIWILDTTGGDWIDVDDRPLVDWLSLGDGQAIEVDQDGRVHLVDAAGVTVSSFPGDQVVPSPTGLPALVFDWSQDAGDVGSTWLLHEAGVREVLDEFAGFGGGFSPDGRIVSWATSDPAGNDTATTLLDLQTGRTIVLDDVWFAGVHFLADGIAYVAEGSEVDEFGWADPVVRYRPWVTGGPLTSS